VNGWLLDTNVLSELNRPRPDAKVVAFVGAQPLDLLFVSTVALAEIRFGIERVTDHARRAGLHHWLTYQLRPMFDGRVLAISEDVMVAWRLMVEEGRKTRHTFPQPDLIVAATASVHGLAVVTRNIADFAQAGVRVFNPWVDESP
jgi:predicted nucleic acid-binding protein